MGSIICLEEREVKRELGELIRSMVEERLNALQDEGRLPYIHKSTLRRRSRLTLGFDST